MFVSRVAGGVLELYAYICRRVSRAARTAINHGWVDGRKEGSGERRSGLMRHLQRARKGKQGW